MFKRLTPLNYQRTCTLCTRLINVGTTLTDVDFYGAQIPPCPIISWEVRVIFIHSPNSLKPMYFTFIIHLSVVQANGGGFQFCVRYDVLLPELLMVINMMILYFVQVQVANLQTWMSQCIFSISFLLCHASWIWLWTSE